MCWTQIKWTGLAKGRKLIYTEVTYMKWFALLYQFVPLNQFLRLYQIYYLVSYIMNIKCSFLVSKVWYIERVKKFNLKEWYWPRYKVLCLYTKRSAIKVQGHIFVNLSDTKQKIYTKKSEMFNVQWSKSISRLDWLELYMFVCKTPPFHNV